MPRVALKVYLYPRNSVNKNHSATKPVNSAIAQLGDAHCKYALSHSHAQMMVNAAILYIL